MSEKFDDAQLIALVKEFSYLYDKSNKKFKNKSAVEGAWRDIAGALNMPVDACEIRWNNIRHRFAKERRHINNKRGTAATSSWQYYEDCLFLDKIVVPRKTSGNFNRSDINEVLSAESEPELSDTAQCGVGANKEIVDGDLTQQESSGSSSKPEPDLKKIMLAVDSERTAKRKRADEIEQLSLSIRHAFENLSTYLEAPDIEDEDSAFGKSVGFELRKIRPFRRKLLVKSKIMQIIAESVEEEYEMSESTENFPEEKLLNTDLYSQNYSNNIKGDIRDKKTIHKRKQ